jgi:hypothetical protein
MLSDGHASLRIGAQEDGTYGTGAGRNSRFWTLPSGCARLVRGLKRRRPGPNPPVSRSGTEPDLLEGCLEPISRSPVSRVSISRVPDARREPRRMAGAHSQGRPRHGRPQGRCGSRPQRSGSTSVQRSRWRPVSVQSSALEIRGARRRPGPAQPAWLKAKSNGPVRDTTSFFSKLPPAPSARVPEGDTFRSFE